MKALVRALALVLALPALPALAEDGACAASDAPVPLANATALTVHAPTGTTCFFVFSPMAGSLFTRVDLTALSSDMDLFVRRGADPTFTEYDCRSWRSGLADERCEADNDGRAVRVMVNPLGGAGSFTIVATGMSLAYCDLRHEGLALPVGTTQADVVTSDRLATCFYELTGDGTTSDLVIALDPEASNMDLYVRAGRRPTLAVYDCRSESLDPAASESCTVRNEAGRVYHILVLNRGEGGAFTLFAGVQEPCSLGAAATPLALGADRAAEVASVTDAECRFVVVGDGATDGIRFDLAADAEGLDMDLFVNVGAPASPTAYACSSADAGPAPETCSLPNVAGETYHVTALRWAGGGAFRVSVTPHDFPAIVPGEPVARGIAGGDVHHYRLLVPAGTRAVALTLASDADANLAVRRGAVPTAAAHDCRAAQEGTRETCVLVDAPLPPVHASLRALQGAGLHYVTVVGASPYAEYELSVAFA